MTMRPNSASILPSHNVPHFKDKPVLGIAGGGGAGGQGGSGGGGGGGSGSTPGSPGALLGRITLRRVILYSGSFLFVYIIVTTVLGQGSSSVSHGLPIGYQDVKDHGDGTDSVTGSRLDKIDTYPPMRRPELDPYNDIHNPLPNEAPPAGHANGANHVLPMPPPASPEYPARMRQPSLQVEVESEGEDEGQIRHNPGTVMVDDDGNLISGEEGEVEVSEVEAFLAKASNARKATPVSYSQLMSANRRERDYAIALIVREADLALRSTEVYSVTNKNQTAPSGDIHDYLSLSKYYWPNKKTASGLPYKRIDGHVNPEIETVRDYRLMRTMIREVHMMGMAYHFTGRKEFADKCAFRLQEWFLDEKTYMNPNINYGSLRKGEKLGARTGVLDMFTIFRVFDALHYLKQEPTWPKDLVPRLQEWFSRYVEWLETSTLAHVERQGNNNHGTYFDVQIIGIYLFLGRTDDARAIARSALHTRIDPQVSADGAQPEEMERKTSWYYSVFNLQALMTLARWGDVLGVDVWFYEGPNGQSVKKAIDYLLPYALSGGEGWPVENLKGFDMTDYLKCVQIAWNIYGDEKYLDAIEYLQPKVDQDMEDGKIKTISTYMCDISTLLGATTRGGQGFIWHWCLT